MNFKQAEFIKELSKTELGVYKQLDKFKEETGSSKATFFRYRKKLGIREIKDQRIPNKPLNKGVCYFCLNPAQHTHHIDKNRENNSKENLLNLCCGCHTKIHLVYTAIGYGAPKSQGFENMRKV